ncbi:MAG: nucleotide sugar dehydrogenase [Chlorobiaceae bacterium]|nr:nucleotide sugar dehydrogenase [Chlorobiaceae bacterium]
MSFINIAIIGLGYVGLPLAVEFAKKYPVTGYDIKKKRVDELKQGRDSTLEVSADELRSVLRDSNSTHTDRSEGLYISSDAKDLEESNYYIVTVPTPTDKNNRPDLTPLLKASEIIGKVLKPGDIVVYESTVYPGATEEECVPVLEKYSGLKYKTSHCHTEQSEASIFAVPSTQYFFCGYSPERINPGDKEHTVTKIKKVTSGSTPEAAQNIDQLYRSIITAGTHLASSIKVAEAAKVIENSQRDINIAFVNELAMIFNRLGIDTHEVLEAAGTKWNFLPFKPGLVGGHCIGVDPYYLAQKAQESGYHPEIILAGRRLNDNMGTYIASEVVKLLIARDCKVKGATVLMLGITFKENCPDIRNTRAVDIAKELKQYGAAVEIYDPWADPNDVMSQYGLESLSTLNSNHYDAVILTVAHNHFKTIAIRQLLASNDGIVYDVKGVLPIDQVDGRL